MQNQSKSFPRLLCAENYLFNKSHFQMQILQLPVSLGWPCGRSPRGLAKAVLCSLWPPQHLRALSRSRTSGLAAPRTWGCRGEAILPPGGHCIIHLGSNRATPFRSGVCTNVRTLHLVEPYSHTGFILIKSQNPVIITSPARPKGTV